MRTTKHTAILRAKTFTIASLSPSVMNAAIVTEFPRIDPFARIRTARNPIRVKNAAGSECELSAITPGRFNCHYLSYMFIFWVRPFPRQNPAPPRHNLPSRNHPLPTELARFLEIWEREATKTETLLAALPPDAYDFRPDPEGRSVGELAWHLVEAEGYGALGIERGEFSRDARPEGITRPRTIEELAPGYARVHADAVARMRKLTAEDLDRPIVFFNGQAMPVRDILMDFILLHNVHHRGQLSLMCREAGGQPTSLFGPTRETMPLPKKA